MFKQRKSHRQARSVAHSWDRIERWLQAHAPEVPPTLRPGASKMQIAAFEQATELALPEDVRESLLIHDGQEESHPGAIVGEPFDPLQKIESTLGYYRQLCEEYEQSDASCGLDIDCTSYPVDAIRCRHFNWKWIAMGDWDGNCYGIDLDPGPNGVSGQVINFGRDEEKKYVLAMSWAHFLEDVADELEAGNLAIARDAQGEVTSFGRPGKDDQALFRFYEQWSKSKLPSRFQQVGPVPRAPVFPGEIITGPTGDEARARVEGFVSAMHDYEMSWLKVRPINELGYRLIIESGSGHRLEGLNMGGCRVNGSKRDEGPKPAPLAKMQMKVHIKKAVRGYRAILKEYCTDRKRSMDGSLVQLYPPHYDPSRIRVANVRRVAADQLLVYTEPVESVTTRYHLRQVGGRWLIDIKDETIDHVEFTKKSLLFGFYG